MRIPHSLGNERMGRNGEGVEDGSRRFAPVLAGIVPGNCFTALNGFDDISVGVVAVVAAIITVVDDLHGNTGSDHVTGTADCGVAAAVTAVTNLRAGTAAVIVGFFYFRRGGIRRRLGILILCGECRYCPQRDAGECQQEYQQKGQGSFHYMQSISSFLWGLQKMAPGGINHRGRNRVCLMVFVLRNDCIPIRHRRVCLRSMNPHFRNRRG